MTLTTPGSVPAHLPRATEAHVLCHDALARIGLRHRLFALARVTQMASYLLGRLTWQWCRRTTWKGTGIGPCLSALLDAGVFADRLRTASRQALVDAAQPWFSRLDLSRTRVTIDRRAYCDTQLELDRRDAPALYDAVEHALAENGVLSSIRDYLGHRAELRRVTLQVNDQWDRFWRASFEDRGLPVPPTAFFHIDNTYGVVKAIIYLSEVDETNGPFGYVPGTHRMEVGRLEALMLRAVDIWLDVYPHEQRLLAALPSFLRMRAKFGDDLGPDDERGQWLVSHERVMTSKEGDIFIFDVKGIHRGGMVRQGKRRVIQASVS